MRALYSCAIGIALALHSNGVQARGFDWFKAHIKPTGRCHGNETEIAASFYFTGRRTANGEAFRPSGHTAASRTLPFGTVIHLRHPRNGRSVSVRINDRGPYGPAHRIGVRLDLARGAAIALGMKATEWICAKGFH